EHAELARTLPSGCSISGLTAAVPARTTARRMLCTHPDLRPGATRPAHLPATATQWVRHCHAWESALAPRHAGRRISWLSIPLDSGPGGHTPGGSVRRMLDVAIGRDNDTDSSLAHYRDLAARMVAGLPGVFFPKPATVEQIWWHWNYTASRG